MEECRDVCDTSKWEEPPVPNKHGGGAVGGVFHKKVDHGKCEW